MHPEFVQLFPFVFAGIILGTFLPLGNDFPLGRGIRPPPFVDAQRPPPGVVFDSANLSQFFGLLVRCLASLRDAIGTSYGLSTNLQSGNARFPQASTATADARTRFLVAARAQGWAGLADISADSLSMVGALRGPDDSLTTQDEQSYVSRYIFYALVDTLSRRDDAVLSPGVLNNLATSFARTRHIPSVPLINGVFEFDNDDIRFILSSMVEIVDLVIALIVREENEPDVRAAFHHFAGDPTSWVRFTHPAGPELIPSIEQIVRQTHRRRSRAGSSRILTLQIPSRGNSIGAAGPSLSTVLTSFNNPFISRGGTPMFDIEAGTGIVTLRDEEVEYLAALFVAALIRFHANDTAAVLSFKRAT